MEIIESSSSAADYDIQHILNISEIIEPSLWPQCCIYKVPTTLLKVKEEAYTPLLISIGPIHHNNKKLEEMQEYKHRYFHYFWNRLDTKSDFMNYKAFLQQEEQNIRRCYQKKLYDISNEQLVDMILLDSVFIMELFLRENKKWEHKDDYIITQLCVSRSIQRDLLLLENQLPIYVLEKLYDTVVPSNVKNHNQFAILAHHYFASCYPPHHKESSKRMFEAKNWEKSLHFTDLIRCSYLPIKLSNQHIDSQKECLKPRTATKLKQAGISFMKVQNRCLLDIKFERKPYLSWFFCLGCLPCFKAKFLFPQLKVDHTTECVLRNLIALEQCHYPDETYICNYVALIDSLIHTKDDAELLVEKEVIVHELGSHEELANLVNGLCKHVVTNSSCYYQLMEDLDEHWRKARGKLRRSASKITWIATLIFRVFQLLLRR